MWVYCRCSAPVSAPVFPLVYFYIVFVKCTSIFRHAFEFVVVFGGGGAVVWQLLLCHCVSKLSESLFPCFAIEI